MSPIDILVIAAIGLPPEQQVDLVTWWISDDDYDSYDHTSLGWWALQLN